MNAALTPCRQCDGDAMDYFDRVELSGCSSSATALYWCRQLGINDIEWLLFNYSLRLLFSAEENRSVGRSVRYSGYSVVSISMQ